MIKIIIVVVVLWVPAPHTRHHYRHQCEVRNHRLHHHFSCGDIGGDV